MHLHRRTDDAVGPGVTFHDRPSVCWIFKQPRGTANLDRHWPNPEEVC
jgi:hypothetical protein